MIAGYSAGSRRDNAWSTIGSMTVHAPHPRPAEIDQAGLPAPSVLIVGDAPLESAAIAGRGTRRALLGAQAASAARRLLRGLRPVAPAAGSRLRVLVCTHSTIQDAAWGGVELYQGMLATALRPDVETLYWIRRDASCQLLDAAGAVLERFAAPDIGWLDRLCDATEEARFAGVLAAYAIDLKHSQHLGHHAASLPLIARGAGVGTLFSVHDFYLVCARYNLLDDTGRFCDIGARTITACTTCLAAAEGLPPDVQQQRRAFMHLVLGAIDLLLFGSAQSEALLLRIYPTASAIRRLVIEVPAPPATLPETGRRMRDDPRADLIGVFVVGNFLRSKGAGTVLRVIEATRPDQFTFHILGMADPEYGAALERLADGHVHQHGRHRPGDVRRPDAQVALHLSTWPETWCISLSESWMARMIPIVSDIGALGARVTHGENGFKVRVGDAAAVLDLLDTLRRNAGLRARIRDAIGPHLWIDGRDYAQRLLAKYRSLVPAMPLGHDPSRPLTLDMRRLHLLPQDCWQVLTPARSIQEPDTAGDIAVLQSPDRITGWQSIQAARCHVDRLCGADIDPLQVVTSVRRSMAGFRPSPGFSVSGWVFVPGHGQAGQVTVCLIHQGGTHVIFLDAKRLPRADVQARLPDATLHSGFSPKSSCAGRGRTEITQSASSSVSTARRPSRCRTPACKSPKAA
nr:glycosyltransferase [uncultured Lichenicoccus sp.]